MRHIRFTGFKQLCEQDDQPSKDFEKSNMDGVLARDLNIVPGDNDDKMDMVSPGSGIEFKGHKLKALNKLLGIEGHDTAMKLIRVIRRNTYGVQIEDASGACDNQGMNTGRELGPFSNRFFPHMPCSPTNGQTWWISAKDWDNIRMPLPPAGGAGGGDGGMGGLTPPPGGSPPPPV